MREEERDNSNSPDLEWFDWSFNWRGREMALSTLTIHRKSMRIYIIIDHFLLTSKAIHVAKRVGPVRIFFSLITSFAFILKRAS